MRVVNDVKLLFDLLFVVRPFLEIIDSATTGVVTVQFGQFLLDDATLLVSWALMWMSSTHHHQFLHH